MPYDPATPAGQVRLLINDTSSDQVFTDPDIDGFLALEGGNVKLAAAQAIDVIADDEALTSKVIKDHDLATDGAKVADTLRKRATALRDQAALELEQSDDGGYFEIIAPCVHICWGVGCCL
jgi:hypothetical protein